MGLSENSKPTGTRVEEVGHGHHVGPGGTVTEGTRRDEVTAA